jgi:uncharacterized membrane protein YdbT with pleckstrin-like domain
MESSSNLKVVKFSASWISVAPQFLLSGILLVIGLYVTAYYEWSVLVIPFGVSENSFTLRLPIFLLLFLVSIARPIIYLYDNSYEASEHHLRTVRGRLSIFKKSQEFAFEDLLGVQVTQGIIQRILGVGSVEVGSKTALIQVRMRGIRNPHEIAKIISSRIDASRINEKNSQK